MRRINKSIALVGLFTLLLNGCLKDLNLKEQGVAFGALVGGAAAYLTCKLDGKESKECRKIAVAGAVAGGVAGALFGKSMEERRRGYATDEAFYNASIESMQQINDQLSDERTAIDMQISSAWETTDSLLGELSTVEDKTARFQSTRKKTLEQKRKLDARIVKYRNELQINRNILADSQDKDSDVSDELANEIAGLQEAIAALDGKSLELASISSVTF